RRPQHAASAVPLRASVHDHGSRSPAGRGGKSGWESRSALVLGGKLLRQDRYLSEWSLLGGPAVGLDDHPPPFPWTGHRDWPALLFERLLDVLLARLHHLFPHGIGASVLIKEGHRLLPVQAHSSFLGELYQVRQRNLRGDFFPFLLLCHGDLSPQSMTLE